ncbi:type II toxin-antitoxin system RelE/ParE family toxin [Nodosilinea sp. PGN35]|uniref:type II toxin-antitoxin system RelE/ParE family toxin n=1 Tax=Nodosilinea sp. PGN35 TaxID=3020489 RepID=UPI0023B2598B|nr:type II toxin-antitoxin system RelE/ParE family toxin [Nodosilinea sp. TSF1-S3]MDF0364988.1 type II toxin-antitoxin system RelE/ParE family toxin [Nodosilinea sp. TSF1-S3]
MQRYVITLEASRDLQEIVDYFLERNVDAGEKFVEEFNRKCERLLQFPQIGKSYEDIRPGLRGILVVGYVLLYKLVGEEIVIVRVVSGYRNLEKIFE